MIEAKKVHYGQYKKYGDSYLVWEITTVFSVLEMTATNRLGTRFIWR